MNRIADTSYFAALIISATSRAVHVALGIARGFANCFVEMYGQKSSHRAGPILTSEAM
jgi:hypothetical protein